MNEAESSQTSSLQLHQISSSLHPGSQPKNSYSPLRAKLSLT